MPLIRALQAADDHEDLSSLARRDENAWFELITDGDEPIGAPAGTPGDADDERARSYANTLARRVESAFPTEYAVHRLEAKRLPGGTDLVRFLTRNPSYDLRSSRLETFIEDNPGALVGIKDKAGTKRRLRRAAARRTG